MSDLKGKLDYMQETKNLIKAALQSKGQAVTEEDTFRDYADMIQNITTGENLDTEITDLENQVARLQETLDNKAGAELTKAEEEEAYEQIADLFGEGEDE